MYIKDEVLERINDVELPYLDAGYAVYLVNEKDYGTRVYIDERDICGVEDARHVADLLLSMYTKIEKVTGINMNWGF